MRKTVLYLMLMLFMFGLSAAPLAQDDSLQPPGDKQVADSTVRSIPQEGSEKVVAYYFHGNRRCPTCRKLESYSQEALQIAFQQELADSTLVWRVINYDQKDNEHYLKDYNLYTKALILSRIKDGQEIKWKNLDKIWELVGNKDMFLKYVQQETTAFLVREKD